MTEFRWPGSGFMKTVEDCPEAVRNYISQTLLVTEHSRILDEIDAFKRMAICRGYNLDEACDRARAAFSAVADGLDREVE